ncbi:MAG: aminotransferase class III-fold pyridoxal phosphate-dependent enzyme, partial [Oscillospiraceae bacterium]
LEKEYVASIAALCKERDILLIVDEVQTGIGRTGKLFCYENYGIEPNIVTLAKGLGGGIPIGAILADDKYKDVITPGTHGTTFGGNPLAAACANVVLDEVINEKFLADVCEKGEYIKAKIKAFGSKEIKGIRGMGMMLGICVGEGKHSEYAKKLLENGVVVLTAGKDTVRLLPPLTITYEEIDHALEIMKGVF